MTYMNIPALAAYIDRIGAEELNFRRFMVKEFRGAYYTEKVLIRILPTGDLHVNNADYAPTEAEAEAIRAALFQANFPKSVTVSARKVNELKLTNPHYVVFDRRDGKVIMVQERAQVNGQKVFIPHTYWSDGVWRKMEPDGALPFWKPEKATTCGRIMVHEGAKAAKAASEISKDHPGSRHSRPMSTGASWVGPWPRTGLTTTSCVVRSRLKSSTLQTTTSPASRY